MLRGSVVYCRRWVYQGKKRRAGGVRHSVNGKVIRKIVADTKEGAQGVLDRLKEDHKRRILGVAEARALQTSAGEERDRELSAAVQEMEAALGKIRRISRRDKERA